MARLDEIMTTDVVPVSAGSSLRAVVEVLRGENVTGAPVVSGSDVVGIVSATDLLEFEASNPGVPSEQPSQLEWGEAEEEEPEEWLEGEEPPAEFFVDLWPDVGADLRERFEEVGGPEWDVLEEHTVDEVMTHTLYSLAPDTDVREAARYMIDRGIHRLVVVEDSRLVGIVTTTDIVRAVAEGKV